VVITQRGPCFGLVVPFGGPYYCPAFSVMVMFLALEGSPRLLIVFVEFYGEVKGDVAVGVYDFGLFIAGTHG
jgi:hypothetical protein